MKRVTACLVLLVFFAAFAQAALAGEEEGVYLIGTVVGYEAGKGITVEDETGTHEFLLTEETELSGEIEAGMTVEVEAEGGKALYIGIIEVEEPAGK